MPDNKIILLEFERAVQRLADALQQPENQYMRDSCIQRFEFCFELAWKCIQASVMTTGQSCHSPRAAFSLALANGWIDDEGVWLDMIEARNLTSHTYQESLAVAVYQRLPEFQKAFAQLLAQLKQL